MLSTILIVDKRKELSIKYKKSIEDSDNRVIIARTLKEALDLIQNLEPDVIIISDSIEEDLEAFCPKIRALTYNFRPVIIAGMMPLFFNLLIPYPSFTLKAFISSPSADI